MIGGSSTSPTRSSCLCWGTPPSSLLYRGTVCLSVLVGPGVSPAKTAEQRGVPPRSKTTLTMAAPEGNDFALDNDGGAPPNNQNATSHGIYADPDNLLAYFEEEDPEALQWITAKHSSYLEGAPFEEGTAKSEQLLQVCVREWSIWQATGLQVREGVIKTRHVQNGQDEWIEVEDEHPVNGALSRLERDVTKRLKELGVLDSPDQQMAQAVGDLENEDYVIEWDDDEDGSIE